jgi:hypothetical protein
MIATLGAHVRPGLAASPTGDRIACATRRYDNDMGNEKRLTEPRRVFLRSGLALAPAALAATVVRAQVMSQGDTPADRRMPNGQLQTDAILKADYEQNVKDARELTALAKSIELDFDKNDENVLSLGLLKKLDDVEKITKRIRGRLRR